MPVDKKRVHEKQEDEIIDRTAPPGEVIYEAVYAEGEHELERNSLELAFSGLAAGLSMGFSMVTEGILQNHLPNTTWQPLITKLGYSVGFLVVILGRQQLFTKNTLTVILPLLRKKKIGEQNVVLTGGCFQNRYLTERAVARLREEKFTPYWHQRIPPNDGGIALGQAVAASWRA